MTRFACIAFGALSALAAQAQGANDSLGSNQMPTFMFSDNFAALMVTLAFLGLFVVFYMFMRGKPSEDQLARERKKKKKP